MILPTKHIRLSNSLLNVGVVLLKHIREPRTVTLLWNDTRSLPEVRTFERFSLALDLLYMLGVIDFQDGLIRRLSE